MKLLLISIIYLLTIVSNRVTAQCYKNQIMESPVAPKPINLTTTVSCTNMIMEWYQPKGSNLWAPDFVEYPYELTITVKDADGNIISNSTLADSTIHNIYYHYYTDTFPVFPGTRVSWSVYSTTEIALRTYKSYTAYSDEYLVPACTAPIASNTQNGKSLQVIPDKKVGTKIYPNPVQFILNVEFNSTSNTPKFISLYNAAGQSVLMKQATGGTTQLDVRQFASGTYFIRISDAGGKVLYNGKVIKE